MFKEGDYFEGVDVDFNELANKPFLSIISTNSLLVVTLLQVANKSFLFVISTNSLLVVTLPLQILNKIYLAKLRTFRRVYLFTKFNSLISNIE